MAIVKAQQTSMFGVLAGMIGVSALAYFGLSLLGSEKVDESQQFGAPVFFQKNEYNLQIRFDRRIRIVLIPSDHCVSFEPRKLVEVLKRSDRSMQIRAKAPMTVRLKKHPLKHPKCAVETS